jgi:hypothetical protein
MTQLALFTGPGAAQCYLAADADFPWSAAIGSEL